MTYFFISHLIKRNVQDLRKGDREKFLYFGARSAQCMLYSCQKLIRLDCIVFLYTALYL